MKKLGLGIFIGFVVLALSGIAIAGIGANKKPLAVPTDEIVKGVFVDYGYSSPPWYPPTEETDTYRWAPRIYWAGGDLPLYITVYTGDEPIVGTFDAIEAGFTTWDIETGTSLYGSIDEATTTWPGVERDGENTVAWASLPGGIIGVTYYWYWRDTKEMVEFDIVLDSEELWSLYGGPGTFSVQGIAAHEAGHTLVLQDLRSPKDGALTMHAYTWLEDTLKNDLGSGDILGVKAIYGP